MVLQQLKEAKKAYREARILVQEWRDQFCEDLAAARSKRNGTSAETEKSQ